MKGMSMPHGRRQRDPNGSTSVVHFVLFGLGPEDTHVCAGPLLPLPRMRIASVRDLAQKALHTVLDMRILRARRGGNMPVVARAVR
jgi:hypothetical protein